MKGKGKKRGEEHAKERTKARKNKETKEGNGFRMKESARKQRWCT